MIVLLLAARDVILTILPLPWEAISFPNTWQHSTAPLKFKSITLSKLSGVKSKNDLKVVVAGGVASNKSIRQSLIKLGEIEDCEFLFPSIKYCTDNGAMIALAGIERFERNKFDKLNFKPRPRWPLDKNALFMKGKRAVEG